MTTTPLTKNEYMALFTAYLKNQGRSYAKMDGRERVKNVMLDIEKYAKYQDQGGMDISYNWTAYAVRWSIDTLRLNMSVEQALNTMTVRQLLTLVYELHADCPTQIDVTHYLNRKYAD